MKLGVVFPTTEIGFDPEELTTYAEQLEALRMDHLLTYEHVLGVDPQVHSEWEGPYDVNDTFHEPMTLYSHLAAVTTGLDLVTGVLILPQRQAPLVAKQAAELDHLSQGRLRLGVGVGWNQPEYDGLGCSFEDRGDRMEEQLEVLERLWTQEVVDFHGEYHELDGVGLTKLPRQRPIPIWMGGMADAVLDRLVRRAEGWFPMIDDPTSGEADEAWNRLHRACSRQDRDPESVGIHARLKSANKSPARIRREADAWEERGADHLAVNTMYQGLHGPEEHLVELERVISAIKS